MSSNYKSYLLRQLGLKESHIALAGDNLDVVDGLETPMPLMQKMISPTGRATPIIAVAIRGSRTGGLPSGADQVGDISPGKLGGYEKITPDMPNSKLVDKTPASNIINNGPPVAPEGSIPPIPEDPHPHQVQNDAGESPQAVTGASNDTDDTLKLKTAMPKGVNVDVSDQGNTNDGKDDMDGEESMKDEEDANSSDSDPADKPLGLNEGKHKAGCTCGFCKNKGKFGKKEDVKEEDKKDDLDETFNRHKNLMDKKLGLKEHGVGASHPFVTHWKMDKEKAGMVKVDEIGMKNECGTCGCGKPNTEHDKHTSKMKLIKGQLDKKSRRGTMTEKESRLYELLSNRLK